MAIFLTPVNSLKVRLDSRHTNDAEYVIIVSSMACPENIIPYCKYVYQGTGATTKKYNRKHIIMVYRPKVMVRYFRQ